MIYLNMTTVRKYPLVKGEIYHIFNRGIDKRTTFSDPGEFARAYESIKYYQYENTPFKISYFLNSSETNQKRLENSLRGSKLVSIICYCFMPNHFHFILREEIDGGISKFMGLFLNSYTRYFNTKHKRVGGLFLDQFKNVLVSNEGQLLHLTRYIHLNPFSSGIVKSIDDLIKYQWSSFPEFINGAKIGLSKKSIILKSFNKPVDYKNFVLSRAEYQKELKELEN